MPRENLLEQSRKTNKAKLTHMNPWVLNKTHGTSLEIKKKIERATNTVTKATNFVSFVTKNSCKIIAT